MSVSRTNHRVRPRRRAIESGTTDTSEGVFKVESVKQTTVHEVFNRHGVHRPDAVGQRQGVVVGRFGNQLVNPTRYVRGRLVGGARLVHHADYGMDVGVGDCIERAVPHDERRVKQYHSAGHCRRCRCHADGGEERPDDASGFADPLVHEVNDIVNIGSEGITEAGVARVTVTTQIGSEHMVCL